MTSRLGRPNTDVCRARAHIYFCERAMREITAEAERLNRSVNWVVERCVLKALVKVREMPSSEEGRRETV